MRVLVSILAVGLLIALHELGHFAAARRMGMKVIRFSVGFFFPLAKWVSKKSGVAYQIGAVPLGGFVQIKGMNPFEEGAYEDADSYAAKPAWRRAIVIVAGPAANFLVAWFLFFCLYLVGHPEPVDKAGIGFTVEGGPAQTAGLEAGDEILSVNGQPLSTWKELVEQLQAHPGKEILLEVKRQESRRSIPITPRDDNGVGKIGIGQPTQRVSLAPHTAALASAVRCGQLAAGAVVGLVGWISGTMGEVTPVGPVGIVEMAAEALSTGFREFLALVAYLSVMLFLFNLFPLPALDGGRGMFLMFEVISRRRVNRKVDAAVNTVGFFLLIGLLLLITAKEVFGLF